MVRGSAFAIIGNDLDILLAMIILRYFLIDHQNLRNISHINFGDRCDSVSCWVSRLCGLFIYFNSSAKAAMNVCVDCAPKKGSWLRQCV